ncbi:MAG: ABC transporter permease [Deltaproteobacteria bacterium]|nr:ABC transporter permease [Deltaproteobacteria bacterium]
MKILALVRMALGSMLRNKVRAALTVLGVVIGVASVVVMIAVGLGARSDIEAKVENLGVHMIVVSAGSSTRGGVSGGAGSFNRLTVDDAVFLDEEAESITAVTPVISTMAPIVGGAGNWRAPIQGVDTCYFTIRAWEAASGRLFTDDEVRNRRKVVVLGHTVAEALWPDQDPVGQRIRLRNVQFEVVGVLDAKGQTADGSDQDDVVLSPYTTVQTRLAGRQFIGQILASAASKEAVPDALAEAKTLMRESHRLSAGEDDDFTVRDQTQMAATAQATTNTMTLLLSTIAGISLLVGGIGIMNIMLVSVSERTREIGIRRAIGAKRRDILLQFVVESVVLSGIGGLLGTGLGFVGSAVVGRITGWATEVAPATVLLAVGFSMAVGAFFGFYPARRASLLDPIEALRHE